MTFPFPFLSPGSASFDPPGSITFDTVGAHNFIIPNYKTQLVIEMNGAGGGGLGNAPGVDGGATTAPGLIAGGGRAGRAGNAGGEGGVASGGDINSNGGEGVTGTGKGGDSPNGGVGGAGGQPGGPPGGGGGGSYLFGSSYSRGGGGGAYVKKIYLHGDLSPEDILSIVVGAGGTTSGSAGAGARGEIRIGWS